MSVLCTLSDCADFITAPEGENSIRPLLHLMLGPYITRVHILMLWTGAWEQIFNAGINGTLHQWGEKQGEVRTLKFQSLCFSTSHTGQETVTHADNGWTASINLVDSFKFVVAMNQPTLQAWSVDATVMQLWPQQTGSSSVHSAIVTSHVFLDKRPSHCRPFVIPKSQLIQYWHAVP